MTDLTRPEPEVVAFTPLNLQVSDFTTLPGHGRYTLGATGQARGRWEWSGTVSLEPLRSTGSFVLAGMKLPEICRVIKSRVNFEITDGELDFRTDYSFDMNGDEIVARLSDASLDLTHLTVREKGKEPNLLTLDTLSVTGMNMKYPEQTVGVGQVRLAGADILAVSTPKMQDFMCSFVTNCIHFYHHGRNVQQFGQGLSATSLNSFWLIRFTAFAASFTKNVIYTAVVSWEILQGIFPMFTYTNQEEMSRKK
ncbi:MAG: DUF748 domain-containing protein [Deltaproteobacteria bacterium]|nr:DUF748 domain-containing protein [Deltaproteobacteria bacterium]